MLFIIGYTSCCWDHFVYAPANERRRYSVTSSLIGWVHTQIAPCSGLVSTITVIACCQWGTWEQCKWNFVESKETQICIYISYHSSTVKWCRQSTSFLTDGMGKCPITRDYEALQRPNYLVSPIPWLMMTYARARVFFYFYFFYFFFRICWVNTPWLVMTSAQLPQATWNYLRTTELMALGCLLGT